MRAWTLSAQVHSPLVISPRSFELFSGSSTASLAATESRIIGVDGSCDGGNVLISQKKDDTWHVEFVRHDDAFRLLPLFVSLNVEMQDGMVYEDLNIAVVSSIMNDVAVTPCVSK